MTHKMQIQIGSGMDLAGVKVIQNISTYLFTAGVQEKINALHFWGRALAELQVC